MENDHKVKSGNDYTINSVQMALRILDLFRPANEPLSLMEISRRLVLSKSTALRMTATLTAAGYLRIHPVSRRYLLGTSALQLGLAAYGSLDLHRAAAPVLGQLADATGCAVHLCSSENGKLVVLEIVLPPNGPANGMELQVGGVLPIFCTGAGLLLLSQESDSYIRQYLEGTERSPYTDKTITDIDSILAQIQKVREDGFCVSSGEYADGIFSITYPIRNHAQRIVAGLSLCGDHERMSALDQDQLHRQLREAAELISHELGAT